MKFVSLYPTAHLVGAIRGKTLHFERRRMIFGYVVQKNKLSRILPDTKKSECIMTSLWRHKNRVLFGMGNAVKYIFTATQIYYINVFGDRIQYQSRFINILSYDVIKNRIWRHMYPKILDFIYFRIKKVFCTSDGYENVVGRWIYITCTFCVIYLGFTALWRHRLPKI